VENTELFEAQLKEILDSGPVKQNPVPTPQSDRSPAATAAISRKHDSGRIIEVIIRIAALAAVIGFLAGFAMRIVSF